MGIEGRMGATPPASNIIHRFGECVFWASIAAAQGDIIAFMDYNVTKGLLQSRWVGFKHFETFINSFYFDQLISNTIIFSLAKLILGMPLAIFCAITLHETWFPKFRTCHHPSRRQ